MDVKIRFFAVLSTCLALPLIPASNRYLSHILAGAIALSGLYWFMRTQVCRSFTKEALWVGAIVFLPWLQIKFAPTCLILIVALILKIYIESKDVRRIALISSGAILSCAILAFYND